MKKKSVLYLIVVFVTALIAISVLAGYYKSTAEQKEALVKLARSFGITLSAEEADVLTKAQPILERLSHNHYIVSQFWGTLRNYESTTIPWNNAKEMIMKGRIRKVMQAHSLLVTIEEDNGQVYTTTENTIDEVHQLIKEVDPKRVFISYTTE